MNKKIYLSAMLLASTSLVFGQIGKTKNLGSSSGFAKIINNISIPSANSKDVNNTFSLTAPSGENIACKTNLKRSFDGKQNIVGNAGANGSFDITVNPDGSIKGLYTSVKDRKAYKYYTDKVSGNVIAEEVDITKVLCIDYDQAPEENPTDSEIHANERGMMAPIPKYESKPGSQYVIYIDLDGEVSTSSWNNGNTINAAARTWSDANVLLIWQTASQDYITFDVNVTTDRAVYNAAAACKRKMCIVTSTTTAAPGSGGVAYIDSFDDCSNNPCWVFNSGAKTAGETVSHEIGHTMGLYHDGKTGGTTYYSGHNNWAPIMGSSYPTNTVGQWSIGEYTSANNTEDDIMRIGTRNGFGPIPDDYGNTIGTAANLVIESNGSVLSSKNSGLINNRTDIDLFKIITVSSGNLSLTINPASVNPDLNVKVRLLNSSGTAIATADPTGTTYSSMSATITSNGLAAGTYYIEIDGVGNGADAKVGYSDYSSIGDYYISGSTPPPSNIPVPAFAASTTALCAGAQVAFTDQSINGATTWKWTFPGGTPSTSTAQNPSITYNATGTYDVKLVVQNSNGKDSLTKTAYIVVNAIPGAPTTTSASRCNPGIVTLKASGSGGTLQWFTTPTGTTTVNTGINYYPNLSTTTTYYVAEVGPAPASCAGPRTPVTGTINTTPATPTISVNGAVLTSSSPTGNQWYLNGTLIPGATNQNYTVTQNGNYTVIVTTNGCSSTASSPHNFTTTGIAQTDNAYFFTIYPNPNDGNFNVSFNTNSRANYKLELRNVLGQLIYQESLTDFSGNYSKQMNVAEYGKGIYLIRLTNDTNEVVKKIITH